MAKYSIGVNIASPPGDGPAKIVLGGEGSIDTALSQVKDFFEGSTTINPSRIKSVEISLGEFAEV